MILHGRIHKHTILDILFVHCQMDQLAIVRCLQKHENIKTITKFKMQTPHFSILYSFKKSTFHEVNISLALEIHRLLNTFTFKSLTCNYIPLVVLGYVQDNLGMLAYVPKMLSLEL